MSKELAVSADQMLAAETSCHLFTGCGFPAPGLQSFLFEPLPAARALFRYEMHTLPDEIDREAATIGTSTLLAAWNAAVYVSQIDDERVTAAMSTPNYLEATRAVLKKYGELWFNDESYIIARKP